MADPNKLSDLRIIQNKLNHYGKLVQGDPSADGPFWRLEKLGNFMGQIQRGIDDKPLSFEREDLPGFYPLNRRKVFLQAVIEGWSDS